MLVTYLDKFSVSCRSICVYGQLMLKMRQNEANLLMWKYIFMVSKTLHFVVKKGLEATLVFLCVQTNPKRFSLSQWYRPPRVSDIPIPKTLPIWASAVTLTLTQLAISNMRRDAHFTRVLAMRMPKTRGCPYHCNIATPETIRGMSTSFRSNDFWDRPGRQALLVIG